MLDFWKKITNGSDLPTDSHTRTKPPHYARSYFDHIAAVYSGLAYSDFPVDKNDARQQVADRQEAESILEKAKDPNALTWGDVFRLESIVVKLQPPDALQRNVWIVRERFREISSPTVYKAYIASNPPTQIDSTQNVTLLRADLSRLVDVLHWYYALIPDRERLRKHLTLRCAKSITHYTFILLVALLLCLHEPHLNASFPFFHFSMGAGNIHSTAATAICVVYWGIIGGFVSSQRRMQNIPSDGDPLISVLGLDDARYYLWLSPLLGAVFAVILAWMFMGSIITGSIFPAFNVPKPPTAGGIWFQDLFHWPPLVSHADYAKLFLWSFLAGFAERLVPDNLDRLASKLQVDDKSTAPAPLAPNPALPAAVAMTNGNGDGAANQPKQIPNANPDGNQADQPDAPAPAPPAPQQQPPEPQAAPIGAQNN
jgi:hypothetical protein